MKNKAIFLDRDGTLNSDEGHYYVHRIEDLKLNTGVLAGLKKLFDVGYKLIVISNQGGISKKEYTTADTDRLHNEINRILSESGCHIDEFYYCPHHDKVENCLCRKPQALMIEKACARYNIDKSQSYMIGDSERDAQAAHLAGIKAIVIPKNSDFSNASETILAANKQ